MITARAISTEAYRAATSRQVVYNHSQRLCLACHVRRSLGQFVAGEDRCAKCVLRGAVAR